MANPSNADHYIAWPGFTPDSINLDIDRWNGDDAAVDNYFGVNQPPLDKLDILWREAELHGWNMEG